MFDSVISCSFSISPSAFILCAGKSEWHERPLSIPLIRHSFLYTPLLISLSFIQSCSHYAIISNLFNFLMSLLKVSLSLSYFFPILISPLAAEKTTTNVSIGLTVFRCRCSVHFLDTSAFRLQHQRLLREETPGRRDAPSFCASAACDPPINDGGYRCSARRCHSDQCRRRARRRQQWQLSVRTFACVVLLDILINSSSDSFEL